MNESPARVFVIDDEPSVRQALARLLRSEGYEVEVFSSAGAYLQRDAYDGVGCVILDVRMPDITGVELHSRLAEAESDIPIVFLTAFGDVPTGVGAIKKGAVDFLSKPVDEEALFEAVREGISHHRKSRADRLSTADLRRRSDSLTAREREVLRYILGGALNREIAEHLGISEKTVKIHRGSIMEKMGASSAAELGRICARAGISAEKIVHKHNEF